MGGRGFATLTRLSTTPITVVEIATVPGVTFITGSFYDVTRSLKTTIIYQNWLNQLQVLVRRPLCLY